MDGSVQPMDRINASGERKAICGESLIGMAETADLPKIQKMPGTIYIAKTWMARN
jgi:hypothetical protein